MKFLLCLIIFFFRHSVPVIPILLVLFIIHKFICYFYNQVPLGMFICLIVKKYTMNKELFKYKTIDSTNNEALRLLRSGRISSQCYIVSDYQQQGRGQKENSWFAK